MSRSVVVMTSLSLPEATVAASMLEAYGLAPTLGEYHHAHQTWTYLTALQGVRVSVPEASAESAGILLAVRTERYEPVRPPRPSLIDIATAFSFFLLFGGVVFPYWLRRAWQWPPELDEGGMSGAQHGAA